MPIEDRKLEAGTVLVARYKGKERTCEAVQGEDGLRYRLDDGTEHRSPSSAARVVMNGVAANGWRFWSIAGTERLTRKPRGEGKPKKAAAKAAPKGKAKKPAKTAPKAKPQRMRAKEVPSYGCGGCGATFGSQKAAIQHALTHTSA